ncbi:family 78 glycoside hydrolase catalytic domain [Halegenticoccus soli]|uniref:family 78 glycoside hydrolase catalytic domain n=1 Tax=Halegenticoccus soli TaxID=1985678 RepID=UPI001E50490F|nr:family 78 glycoside hydrolase catalytic domain [Halegenticoccus soli]
MSRRERSVDVDDLRVEYETNPINVEPTEPRFSWRANSSDRGAKQTAYRILVARSPDAAAEERGELWDTGKVYSSKTTNVTYDGTKLDSNADYYWTVRVWDENDRPSEWADVATFSTALAGDRAWEGGWIGYRPDGGDSNGYVSRWHPADTDAEEWIQVDLGGSQPIDRVELYPANPFNGPETPDGMEVSAVYAAGDPPGEFADAGGPSGFGFPVRYRIDVSDDPTFEDSRTVVDRTDTAQENPGTDTVAIDTDVSARYVRITATELYEFDPSDPPSDPFHQLKTEYVGEERRAWRTFSLAALAVRDANGDDLALGRPVEASSSTEEDGWGGQRLVNGYYESRTAPGSPLLRSEVTLGGEVKRAMAHVCTLGYGELYVNGKKISDDVLNPGWTKYDERALYSTYDVADALEEGENALGIWLGRGWFSRNARDWTGFGAPRAILQLEIEYEDGTTRSVSTDSSWRASQSPIVMNDIYDGETYDARLEQPGWAEPGFDDAEWDGATVVDSPGGDLVPQRTPPIRVTETLNPVEVHDHNDGPIIDFGQNLVGWVELTIDGASEGDEIRIRHAETLLEDGSLSLVDLRTADATDTYIAAGSECETYHPRFTYHGFRYAQVENYPGELAPEDVRARVVHTDVRSIGSFDCSNEDLSQVQRNARWGLRGNIHSVLTDCPQRDERFGWTGDNHIAARALMYNFDALLFYEKWLDDHADAQSEHGYIADTIPYGYGTVPEDPTWGITQVTIPWHLYRHYGDVGVLECHYEGMRRYVDYWHDQSDDGIVPDEYGNYGDWLAFENNDGRRGLPFDLFNTAFHYHTTHLFAKIATVLGNNADAELYATRAGQIAEAFNEAFFDADGGQYGPGTQASYAVPLFVGLVPDEREEAVAAGLAEKVHSDGNKLQTGFLGTRPLIHTLVNYGYEEIAYQVVSQPERPGWVYMVRQGATTMWERWDSDSRIGDGMNSFNHSPFNFVSEWLFEAIAGLRFDESADDTSGLRIAPLIIDDLDWAEGEIETKNGRLFSRWDRTDDGITLEVEVPWNSVVTVRIPIERNDITVTELEGEVWNDGAKARLPDGIRRVFDENEAIVLEVESGSYRFDVVNYPTR